MRVLKIFCLLACLSCVADIISTIHRIYSPQPGSISTEHGILKICLSFAGAVIYGAEFYGIHKKARFAWNLGWVILAATFAEFLVAALRVSEIDHPRVAFAAVMVGASCVLVYWGFWWKRQEGYFTAQSSPNPSAGKKELALVFGISALVIAAFTLLSGSTSKNQQVADRAVAHFHEQLAAEQYVEIYEEADETLRETTSEADFVNMLQSIHQTLGVVRDSVPTRIVFQMARRTTRLDYVTTFERGNGREQFVWQIRDNQAALHSYRIDSKSLAKK
jgi:hypothetical protein